MKEKESLLFSFIFYLFFRENFYSLAWTTIDMGEGPTNILVSGGIRGKKFDRQIYLFY